MEILRRSFKTSCLSCFVSHELHNIILKILGYDKIEIIPIDPSVLKWIPCLSLIWPGEFQIILLEAAQISLWSPTCYHLVTVRQVYNFFYPEDTLFKGMPYVLFIPAPSVPNTVPWLFLDASYILNEWRQIDLIVQ